MPIYGWSRKGEKGAINISRPTCSGINDAFTHPDVEIGMKKAREAMDKAVQYLISKDNGNLQIPYEEYIVLMEKAEEAKRICKGKNEVLANLEVFLNGSSRGAAEEQTHDNKESAVLDTVETVEAEEMKETVETIQSEMNPATKQVTGGNPVAAKAWFNSADIEVPPIKKEIAEHFKKLGESGRLLDVFREYYTCLNDRCGNTVRVTMKDGFCSLWNYDEWEEFAFVDSLEGNLRFAVDPRYTDALSALSICEVPRLLSTRRNLVCVQVGDLNTTMLNVLVKAFEGVGKTTS